MGTFGAAGESESILARLVASFRTPALDRGELGEEPVLFVAASRYGSCLGDDADITLPTGFDPEAAALFEAIVECAYLVANADGEFDSAERKLFGRLVLEACGRRVAEAKIDALIEDLGAQLEEDGLAHRLRMVGRAIRKDAYRDETLRIAALLALASAGVSDIERRVLSLLARELSLPLERVDAAISAAEAALAG
jgi:tellurite resistance protein